MVVVNSPHYSNEDYVELNLLYFVMHAAFDI